MAAIEELIERLAATKGDTNAQAAFTAEFLVSARPEAERQPLHDALDAAAVLHWFDPGLLGRVLEASEQDASRQFKLLDAMPFVERYSTADPNLRNIHECARLGLRKHLANARPEYFLTLSARAATCFADDHSTTGRIEWIYHLLCGEPDHGAAELEKLDREWSSRAHPEDRAALATALKELEDTQVVQGRARVWVLLVIAWAHVSRGLASRLADLATSTLHLARVASDPRAEGDAQCLLGDVWQAQGKLADAHAAYGEYLAISQHLAEQDPSNAGWQRELGVAVSRVGKVLQAQGKLAEAQAAFGENLAISRRLVEQDPGNAGWQRELALALFRVGKVLQGQGKLAQAEAAFGECLAILRRLVVQDPSNAGWQRELGVAVSGVGKVSQAQGKLAEARAAFGENLAILRRLVEQDPSNAEWRRDLTLALRGVGEVFQAQGKLAEAEAAFAEYSAISRRLVEQDASENRNSSHTLAELGEFDFAWNFIDRALVSPAPITLNASPEPSVKDDPIPLPAQVLSTGASEAKRAEDENVEIPNVPHAPHGRAPSSADPLGSENWIKTQVDAWDIARKLSAFLSELGRVIERLPRWIFNRWSLIAIDASISMVAIWLGWQLCFDFNVPTNYQTAVRISAVTLLLVRPAVLWSLGVYRAVWRYFNFSDAVTLCVAATPLTIVLLLLRIGWLHSNPIVVLPLTVILVDYGAFILLGFGIRSLRRYLFEASHGTSSSKRTLLMGTEEGLASALRQISNHPEIHVVCLLSPDRKLHGARLAGCTVSAGPESLPKHLAAGNIDLVLIADADVESMGDVIATAMEFGVEARLLPLAAHIISGDVRISYKPKPELAIKHAVPVTAQPHPAVLEAFRGRRVLITGAGGSIGSELSRQVARLPVDQLVLLDQDESSIFQMNSELSSNTRPPLVSLVADIRNRERITSVFRRYRPDIVLHAAAYKYVHMMEENCSEAVLNNVLGTRIVAETAIDCGAERFLMISTDKAVNPSSIMGATKRMAELTVQHLALSQSESGGVTRCACVRFGNVVGSSGSIVPIFLRQIASGGPVTITHEEMTRYFMTIPSAVQLVLQATTLGSNGEVYMLDIGEPVKIAILARRLIEMSGLRPGEDIEIRFVGLRPGEKLHDQLWSDSATVNPTTFPSVLRVEPSPPPPDFGEQLASLEAAVLTGDDELVRRAMKEMPIDYSSEQEEDVGRNPLAVTPLAREKWERAWVMSA